MLQGLANNVDHDQIATSFWNGSQRLLGHKPPNINCKSLGYGTVMGLKAIRQDITRAYMHAQATVFCLS